MLTLRKDIAVPGVPGTWTTNLSDADIRAFHETYGSDDQTEFTMQVLTLELKFRWGNKTVPFKDGACLWNSIEDKNWVLYRTSYEWEIWAARKQELDELEEEQEQERAAMSQLMRTENDHLSQSARAAVEAKDFAEAERHLIARAELAKEIERLKLSNWWSHGIIENVGRWFASFPSSANGIAFLKKYDCRANSFLAYANYSVFGPRRVRDVQREAELEKVFDAAASLFPKDGWLFKETCLFWRRRNRLDLAIKYCKTAIANDVRDDTKSGFSGRLKRLQREQAQFADSPTVNPTGMTREEP